MKSYFYTYVLFILLLVMLRTGTMVWAAEPKVALMQRGNLTLDSSHVEVPDKLISAIINSLQQKPDDFFEGSQYILTSAHIEGDWALVSIASLDGLYSDDETVGTGESGKLAIAQRSSDDSWQSGIIDTPLFSDLLEKAPDWFISAEAKSILSMNPNQPRLAGTVEYKFPWAAGQSWSLWTWYYQTYGSVWHQVSGNHGALDFGTSSSDKRVLAAAGGTITNICVIGARSFNITIRDSDGVELGYSHLDKNLFNSSIIGQGKMVQRGQVLGSVVAGDFSDNCGSAIQFPSNGHLHWVLPIDRTLVIDGWTLQYPKNYLQKGSEHKWPGASFLSTNHFNLSPRAPTQTAPANGSITTNRTIPLTWNNGGDATSRDFYAEVWKSDNSWKTQRNWNTATSWNVTVPGPGTYQWRVKAKNGSAESTWSSTWSFNVTNPLPPETSCLKPLLRYWNEARQKHYYTADRTNLGIGRNGWVYETFEGYIATSADCYAPGATPLYQLWHAGFQKHFYTTSASEAASVVENRGYTRQADVGYVLTTANSQYQTLPLYRLYKHAIRDHFYTTHSDEKDDAVKHNYIFDWVDGYLFSPDALRPPETACLKPLLRYWNNEKKKHFYTSVWGELGVLKNNWVYERFEGYVASTPDCYAPGAQPLYRLWSDSSQKHFYTASLEEANQAVAQSGFKRERDVGYILRDSNSQYHTTPLYQLYKASTKDHFYTITATERDSAVSTSQYEYERIAAYVFGSKALNSPPPATPTASPTPTPTATRTFTPQPAATRTFTPQPAATRTFTPQPMATPTFTPLPGATITTPGTPVDPVIDPDPSTGQRVYLPLIIR